MRINNQAVNAKFFLVLLTTFLINSLFQLIHADVPGAFIYQGSLKQNGIPVNATSNIEIRLTNIDGSQTYWTNGVKSVPVKEGLYRIELAPTGIDWNTVTPYIETRVNNTVLLPREKLSSTPYALLAKEANVAKALPAGTVNVGDLTFRGKIKVLNGNVGINSDEMIVEAGSSEAGKPSQLKLGFRNALPMIQGSRPGQGTEALVLNPDGSPVAVGDLVTQVPVAKFTVFDATRLQGGNTKTLFNAGYQANQISGNRQFLIQQWVNDKFTEPLTARTYIIGNGYISGTSSPSPRNGPSTSFQGIEFRDDAFGFVYNSGAAAVQPALMVKPTTGRVGVGTDNPRETLEVAGRTRIKGQIADGAGSGESPYQATLRVQGEGDFSNGRLVVLQAPWDTKYEGDRIFMVGYNGFGTQKFSILGTGQYVNSSSRVLKENIFPLQKSLDRITKVSGVSYNWKGQSLEKRTMGFIAEDLEKIVPEAVVDGKMVDYSSMIPLLVESIKQLKEQVDALQQQLKKGK